MGRIIEQKYKIQKRADHAILEEALRRVELAEELKKQGKDAECDQVMKDMRVWAEKLIRDGKGTTEEKQPPVDERSSLPQAGEVLVEGEKLVLSVIKEDEKEKYLSISAEYSYMKKVFEEEEFRETLWNDFLSDSAFVCSIYEKKSREYVGYCSIRNLLKKDWELAIELQPDACHKGYGTEVLTLLMQALNKLTGRRFFRARVEIDNHASQGLMKKLGAAPDGISEFLLHGEEIERFQEEYKEMITDEIRAVAKEFCMDAEDILGYVLEYRLDVEKLEAM